MFQILNLTKHISTLPVEGRLNATVNSKIFKNVIHVRLESNTKPTKRVDNEIGYKTFIADFGLIVERAVDAAAFTRLHITAQESISRLDGR